MTTAAKTWLSPGLPDAGVRQTISLSKSNQERTSGLNFEPAVSRPRYVAIGLVIAVHVLLVGLLLQQRHMTRPQAPALTTLLMAPEWKPAPQLPQMVTPALPNPAFALMPKPEFVVADEAHNSVSVSTTLSNVVSAVSAELQSDSVTAEVTQVVLTEAEIDYLQRPVVRYPMASQRAREQGTVWLTVAVDSTGRVSAVAVTQSSGFVRLDEAAMRAVRIARFRPHVQNGVAISVQVLIPVEFAIGNGTQNPERGG